MYFKVERQKVKEYIYMKDMISIVCGSILLFGLGLILGPLYAVTIGRWLPQKQVDALQYWLDGNTLRVKEGVYVLTQKSIPLDRITDVMLTQDPLLRWYGIWNIHIQTAGAGGRHVAEAILIGVKNPEQVRDAILDARNKMLELQSAK